MSDRDYYEVLGLTPRADGTMVDQAYWHQARKYQSLATTNARGRRLLDELNEAYGVLGNARLRKEYDAFRDDVLVAGGVIGPVRSKAKTKTKAKAERARPAREVQAGGRALPAAWRTYLLVGLIAAAGAAATVVSGRMELAAIGIAVALVVGVAPAVRRRINITMPALSLPAVSMPSVSLPSVSMPSMPQPSVPGGPTTKRNFAEVAEHLTRGGADDAVDADELHASTSAVIARWRKSMGLRTQLNEAAAAEPSSALVDIVEVERQIEERESEPLMAVIDILRGAHKSAGARNDPGDN